MSNRIKLYIKDSEFRLAMRDIKEVGIRHWPARKMLLERYPYVYQYELEIEDGPGTTFLLLKYQIQMGHLLDTPAQSH